MSWKMPKDIVLRPIVGADKVEIFPDTKVCYNDNLGGGFQFGTYVGFVPYKVWTRIYISRETNKYGERGSFLCYINQQRHSCDRIIAIE